MLFPFRSVLERHAHMIFDFRRTLPLLKAIQKKLKPDDIVVDIGCGLGLLAFAACRAGAKRVYAVDVDGKSLEFGRWQAKQLGMDKKICFFEEHSINVDIIEKADLLIQETVGPLAFDENFLPTLIDAKKRFLKPGAKIIPEEVSLYGVPIDRNKKFLAKPKVLKKIKTRTAKQTSVQIETIWVPTPSACPERSRHLQGVLVWPHIMWAKGYVTDCSPLKPKTHWVQTLLPCGTRYRVVRYRVVGKVKFSLKISPHPLDSLHYTDIKYHIVPGT